MNKYIWYKILIFIILHIIFFGCSGRGLPDLLLGKIRDQFRDFGNFSKNCEKAGHPIIRTIHHALHHHFNFNFTCIKNPKKSTSYYSLKKALTGKVNCNVLEDIRRCFIFIMYYFSAIEWIQHISNVEK
jgi:hypothetical protein